jgi:fibro-slime domain-containing protein
MKHLTKTLVLALLALGFLVQSAWSQNNNPPVCGGDKTVYLQVPDGWTSGYYEAGGTWTEFDDIENGYFVIPLKGGQGTTFIFGKIEGYHPNTWIDQKKWAVENLENRVSFTCDLFEDGDVLYVSDDPTDPGNTVVDTNPPNAKYVYFLPPNDKLWIGGGTPSIVVDGKAESMMADSNLCGWFYKVYFNVEPPTAAVFCVGTGCKEAVDVTGWAEDPTSTTPINLNAQFNTLLGEDTPGTIYLIADDLPDPLAWTISSADLPIEQDRCSFRLAAYIRDTDPYVHPDFSCGIYQKGFTDEDGSKETNQQCEESPSVKRLKGKCTGVVKGLVKQTLDPVTKKIEYSGDDDKDCWTSAQDFANMFKHTPEVNVEHCYDMPFTQQGDGYFEFDSDKLKNGNGNLVGGFFTDVLANAADDDDCPSCNTKRLAEVFTPVDLKSLSVENFDEYESEEGDFKDGETPKAAGIPGNTAANKDASIWDWAQRDTLEWYAQGSKAIKGNAKGSVNQHFCFESHAQFVYDPAQVFYFRGDDDIWVYIDNKLVIDLGGAHMAAPGHVELSTLGLTEGNEYDIDIFFCDRRTTQSNVRIKTNMYVSQTTGLSAKDPTGDGEEAELCLVTSGGGSCGAALGGGGSSEKCGEDLWKDPGVDIYLVSRANPDEKIYLNEDNPACSVDGDFTRCYGGIVIGLGTYSCGGARRCQGNSDATKKVNLTGNYTVYAQARTGTDGTGARAQLDRFRSESNTNIVWGTLNNAFPDECPLDVSPTGVKLLDAYGATQTGEIGVVAGRRFPLYFASGSWEDEKTFGYDCGGGSYSLTDAMFKGKGEGRLQFYTAETDGERLTAGTTRTIPVSGIDTLWAEANFVADDYTINLKSVQKINVYMPELHFADAEEGPDLGKTRSGNLIGDKPPYINTTFSTLLFAYDKNEKSNELGVCTSCKFTLYDTSYVTPEDSPINDLQPLKPVSATGLEIKDGWASISLRGRKAVYTGSEYAEWKVYLEGGEVSAIWDDLQFRELPVPAPVAEMYDVNGDGIGDSLRVVFDKKFQDTLYPNALVVLWTAKDTVVFLPPGYALEDIQKQDGASPYFTDREKFQAAAQKYFSPFLEPGSDSILAFGKGAIDTLAFSEVVKTKGFTSEGKGEVSSWASFMEGKDKITMAVDGDVEDKMPAIVTKARYTYEEKSGQGTSASDIRREKIQANLSEPVWKVEDAGNEDVGNPFAYKLVNPPWLSPVFQNLSDLRTGSNASLTTYSKSRSGIPDGDSSVTLNYNAWKDLTTKQGVMTPVRGDSARVRFDIAVFRDANGNTFNPNEIGVLIEGSLPPQREPVELAVVDPNDPTLDKALEDYLKDHPKKDSIVNSLFGGKDCEQDCSVGEILPLPSNANGDTAKARYPASNGVIFQRDIYSVYDSLMAANPNGEVGEVRLVAQAFYHTSLGDYAAQAPNVRVSCNAPIFQIDAEGKYDKTKNCITEQNRFYLAWNLKSANGRTVGTGVYVMVYKFNWEMEYKKNKSSKDWSILRGSPEESTQKLGVRRTK